MKINKKTIWKLICFKCKNIYFSKKSPRSWDGIWFWQKETRCPKCNYCGGIAEKLKEELNK